MKVLYEAAGHFRPAAPGPIPKIPFKDSKNEFGDLRLPDTIEVTHFTQKF